MVEPRFPQWQYDIMNDLADRWNITPEEAENYLEDVGALPTGPEAELPPEPRRPDDVAAYILDGVDRQSDPETLRAIAEYASARADHLEALEAQEVDPEDVVDDGEQLVDVEDENGPNGTTYTKKIPCGKDCSGCPHGPYKYRSYREGDEVKTEYLGKA